MFILAFDLDLEHAATLHRVRMTEQLRDIARQHLKTSRLLGVDFMPVRAEPPQGAEAGESRLLQPTGESKPPTPDVHESARPPGVREKGERPALLENLRARHDATCPHCTTVTGHSRTVFGEGSSDAEIMFIGEAPGEEEDRTGRPFVGRAGQKLDEIIRAMGRAREDVYIANILKSRPPDNRTPLLPEVEACSPFLREQIEIIQPRVLVALGGPAAKMLLQTETGITRLRGQWGWYECGGGALRIPVMPTFHPAYLLRNYTPDTRRKIWSDMQEVIRRVNEG